MHITLTEQACAFLYSCAFGAALSILYDLFRLVRMLTGAGRVLTAALDLFYFFACGVFTFAFIMAVTGGEVRGYIYFGELLGWLLYHLTLGNLFVKFLALLAKGISRLLEGVFRPVRVLMDKAEHKTTAFIEAERKNWKERRQSQKKDSAKQKKPLKPEKGIVYNKKKVSKWKNARRK